MVGAVSRTTLITGGAGYVGALACRELLAAGRRVRVLDRLLHGQEAVADDLEAAGVELIRGDVRDAAAREAALQGVDEVVHLAAIVGDPACARDPETAAAVNIEGTRGIIDAAQQAGATRLVFASTCSNYGRMVDPTIPIDETGELRAGLAVRRAEGRDGAAPARAASSGRCDRPACASRPSTASPRACAST